MTLLELTRICDEIKLPVGHLRVGFFRGSEVLFVQIIDAAGSGRKWAVSSWATESEVVLTVLAAAIAYAEHEVRETFAYKGVRLFHPHPDLAALAVAAEKSAHRG